MLKTHCSLLWNFKEDHCKWTVYYGIEEKNFLLNKIKSLETFFRSLNRKKMRKILGLVRACNVHMKQFFQKPEPYWLESTSSPINRWWPNRPSRLTSNGTLSRKVISLLLNAIYFCKKTSLQTSMETRKS